jgi:probable rRNA maturation factor
MPVWIECQQRTLKVSVAALKKMLESCLKRVGLPKAEVAVLITDDKVIKRLNHQYRQKNQPTDVLSFSMREVRQPKDPLPPHPEVLGDLVVSLETVARQAQSRKTTLQAELEFICVHGLLHLLGYDHKNRMQELRMNALQATLLAACRQK